MNSTKPKFIGERVCVVCDASYPRGTGCTNRCCASCHRHFCTAGGITSPGHGINVPAARATLKPAPSLVVPCGYCDGGQVPYRDTTRRCNICAGRGTIATEGGEV